MSQYLRKLWSLSGALTVESQSDGLKVLLKGFGLLGSGKLFAF